MKNEINSVFVNPIKFHKTFAASKNHVIYYSVNTISFSEMSADRNK